MKTLRIVVAFFQALLVFILIGFISALLYSELSFPYNLIVAAIVLILALTTSAKTFNMIRRRGVIATMVGNNASYELDELEPTQDSGVQKLNAKELESLFLENELELNPVKISIWADWEGRQLNKHHELQSIEFNDTDDILTITFLDNCLLKIKSPQLIMQATTYLKIVKAKEVLWQVPNRSNSDRYTYLNTGKMIKTKSTTNWKPHKYDLGIGMQAIYLQG